MQDKKILSNEIYKTKPKHIVSWLRCCIDLRNICSHYGRLYFRIFSAIPSGIKNLDDESNRKLWAAILSLKELYPFKNRWNEDILKKLIYLMNEHENNIELEHIGFPKKLKEELKI